MSYDVYFIRRNDGPLGLDQFSTYFSNRPNYEVEGTQAWYTNEDTGVYFSFDHTRLEGENEDGVSASVASFNLNYFRPPFFGLEAAPEITAFVRRFDLIVHDPQVHGMGDGDYSEDGFLRGWNAGNAVGYRAILSQQGDEAQVHSMPDAKLLAAWEWNRQRARLQENLGEAVFVPKVAFFEFDGGCVSGIVWTDAIPVLIPTIDVVVVVRQELAPRRFFRRQNDIVAVSWSDVAPLIEQFPVEEYPQRHARLLYEEPPRSITDFVKALPAVKPFLQALRFDQVLSTELLSAARDGGAAEVAPDS